jgi:hypothetical protein
MQRQRRQFQVTPAVRLRSRGCPEKSERITPLQTAPQQREIIGIQALAVTQTLTNQTQLAPQYGLPD